MYFGNDTYRMSLVAVVGKPMVIMYERIPVNRYRNHIGQFFEWHTIILTSASIPRYGSPLVRNSCGARRFTILSVIHLKSQASRPIPCVPLWTDVTRLRPTLLVGIVPNAVALEATAMLACRSPCILVPVFFSNHNASIPRYGSPLKPGFHQFLIPQGFGCGLLITKIIYSIIHIVRRKLHVSYVRQSILGYCR